MYKEIFEVTKERFHLQDPTRYGLQGTWPKEGKMLAFLDNSQLKADIQKLEIVSAMERFKDPDRIRKTEEEYLAVVPEKFKPKDLK